MDFLLKFANGFAFDSDGMVFMWALLVTLVFMLAIAIDRYIYIYVRSNVNANRFMAEVLKLVKAEDIQKAINLCKSAGEKALPIVVLAALERAKEDKNFRAIQNAVDEGTLAILPKLNRRTNLLQMIGNVSTLIGLMGTIYGLIKSFEAVANPLVEQSQKTQLLAQGIAIAMNTTLFGLAVAIPAIVIHQIIINKTGQIIEDIDENILKLVNLLTGE